MTAQLANVAAVHADEPSMPGIVPATLARIKVELLGFIRNPQSLVFTVSLPLLLMLIFGSVFSGPVEGTDVDFRQVFISGIIAAGAMSTAFSGLTISVVIEREHGIIRRMASSPMPKSAYFIGKVLMVLITTVLEVALLLLVAVLLFQLDLPATAALWGTFIWVLLLGTAACTMAGFAYCALIPNAKSAAAVTTPPFMILQFISGVFYPFHMLPGWMQTIASVFPLAPMTRGFRHVFLPDTFKAVEAGGVWNLQGIVVTLVAWIILGTFLTAITFKWRGPRVR
ncbi:ABC transporter permease [Propioniferax innocua]|uniref:Transport permease protein n=1 Tax=Propioniferax innocua TaxID=1753 RepID=A0A542ZAG6_9ACTN|nr:ABC transporter permease [Propioniferax innocua]TQL57323.1 ABC-2 type transport system permease protein [Propioniferax innocua]